MYTLRIVIFTDMKKILLLLTALLLVCGSASAQSNVLNRLKNRAKNAVENNIGNKIEKGINDALDGKKKDKDKNRDSKQGNENSDEPEWMQKDEAQKADDSPDVVAQNVKNDFVRGSVIMFEDDMKDEQVGEFPSKWDLVRGNAEIATVNGQKCIALIDGDGWITPLVKGGIRNYLGDVFTVEYDMLFDDRPKNGAPSIELDIMHENSDRDWELFTIYYHMGGDKQDIDCSYTRPTAADYHSLEGRTTAHGAVVINDGRWHHYALSFNERAIKFYVDGKRVVNVPNAKAGAGWLTLWSGHTDVRPTYVKDVVIAQGAVDLYERNATDIESKLSEAAAAVEKAIAETGKFVTNNILFDTGKATIKPESQAEIDKIAEYMKANPNVRFEVQGHTDNQGSDAVNDPLSQQRAEAVVKALEAQGVDPFNLRPVGKGSHEPVADNGTDEGRAKNRRVEFIKK